MRLIQLLVIELESDDLNDLSFHCFMNKNDDFRDVFKYWKIMIK